MSQRPRDRLATLLSGQPDRLRSSLADTLSALLGEKVSCEPYEKDTEAIAEAFGEARLYVAAIAEGGSGDAAGLVVLDRGAAIRCGGALAMLPPEEVSAVAQEGEVPEKVTAAMGEVGALIVGALSKLIAAAGADGRPELAAGGDVEARDAGPWPDAVAGLSETDAPAVAAYGLTIGETTCGKLLVASNGNVRADGVDGADGAETPESLDGMPVRFLGRPGDPAQVSLGELLEALGARVLPMHSAEPAPETPVAAFVVSRSPADLRVRMESLGVDGSRPALVIACSDRPTRDLVLTARQAGADDFLVLPTSRERVLSLMARTLQPA